MGAGGGAPGGPKNPTAHVWQAIDDSNGGSAQNPTASHTPSAAGAPRTPSSGQTEAGVAPAWGSWPAAPATPKPQPSATHALTERVGTTGGTLIGTISELSDQRFETVNTSGNQVAGQVARGLVFAPFKAVGMIAGLLFAPLRFLLMPSLSRSPRSTEADRMQVPGTPFVLRTDDGQETECYLRGEVRGGFIRLGDRVEVTGRMNPSSRVVRVSRLVNQRTLAVTRGHVDPRARLAPLRAVAAVVFLLAVVLFLVSWVR